MVEARVAEERGAVALMSAISNDSMQRRAVLVITPHLKRNRNKK